MLVGFRGITDQKIRTAETPRDLERKIIDAEMDAVGARRERQIDAVVHEKERVTSFAKRRQRRRERHDLAIGRRFPAKLHRSHAASQRRRDHVDGLARALIRVDDEIESQPVSEVDFSHARDPTRLLVGLLAEA